MNMLVKILGKIINGQPGPQGPQGIQGIQGEPGTGVPPGGKKGQVLIKKSDEDFDTEWIDIRRNHE